LASRHTYQKEDITALFADTSRDTNGEFGDPKLVANLSAALKVDDWTYNWTVNYIGSVSNVSRDDGSEVTYRGETFDAVNYSDAVLYHAFSVNHSFNDEFELTFGAANIFAEEPPKVSRGTSVSRIGKAAFYSQYDWRGRRVFANLSYKF